MNTNIKAEKSLFDLFIDFALSGKEKKQKQAKQLKTQIQSNTAPKKEVKRRNKAMCVDISGNFVKCRIGLDNRAVTEDGFEFSGTIREYGQNGEAINTKYKNGHKIKQSIGENTVKVYTANCTKLINKNSGTESEIKITESAVNKDCKSMIYFDSDVKCAYIDFDKNANPNFAGLELRFDGTIQGLKEKNGRWSLYEVENGEEKELDKIGASIFYKEIKKIMTDCKENSLLAENNNLNYVERQIYQICGSIIETV